jgi:hypothetical protein
LNRPEFDTERWNHRQYSRDPRDREHDVKPLEIPPGIHRQQNITQPTKLPLPEEGSAIVAILPFIIVGSFIIGVLLKPRA